ncbi:MAG: hypothetical protein HFG90_07305 [Acholeplasmatales bacterium]|jgi:hypothetical protein|nr:hypothetical protein [Acholeplasmatales bacterium]
MIDKQGNKRKISFRYICWFIGSVIMFTAFFLILVLHYRIFDKYETTEIIKINGITDPKIKFTSGKLEITLMVDGDEFITYFQEPIKRDLTRTTFRVGDKIQYLAGDPDKIFPDRIKGIVILSCAEAVIFALLIGTTIFEIKKGL